MCFDALVLCTCIKKEPHLTWYFGKNNLVWVALQPKGLHLHMKSVSPPLPSPPFCSRPLSAQKTRISLHLYILWRSKAILIDCEFLVNVAWSFKAVTVMTTIVLRDSLCTDWCFYNTFFLDSTILYLLPTPLKRLFLHFWTEWILIETEGAWNSDSLSCLASR